MNIYLMVKTHQKTGLKYLCKTTKDPFKYTGSGIYWIQHLRRYGYNITTEIIKVCSTKEELSYWGRHYSKLWNIVNSQDDFGNKIWANIIPETGGGDPGPRTEITKQKLKNLWNNSELRLIRSNDMKKILSDPKIKLKMSEQQKRIKNDLNYKLKNKEITIASWQNPIIRSKRINAMKLKGSDPEFKKIMSNVTSGSRNPGYDHIVYNWIHESGIQESLTRYELIKKYKLNKVVICRLIKGRGLTHRGWKLIKSASQ